MAMLGKPTPELRYQKAWMLIQFARNYQALGDTTKWQERAVAAQQLLQTLSDGDPKNTAYIRDLAIAESTLGARAKGDLDGALQNYGISLSRVLELANADPDNGGLLRDVAVEVERADWQRDLAIAHGRVGLALAQRGKMDDAFAELRKGRALVAGLKDKSSASAALAQDLVWFDKTLAGLEDVVAPAPQELEAKPELH